MPVLETTGTEPASKLKMELCYALQPCQYDKVKTLGLLLL